MANGVTLELSKKEFWDFCQENKQTIEKLYQDGETPSIDRIDSTRGYCLDNIRIVRNSENIRRQYGRIPIEYDGMILCFMLAMSKVLGVSVGLVGMCLSRNQPYKGKYFTRLYPYTQRKRG